MSEKPSPAAKKLAASLPKEDWDGQKWEYRRERCGTSEELEAKANVLGERGWELVAVWRNDYRKAPGFSATNTHSVVAVFKRPKAG